MKAAQFTPESVEEIQPAVREATVVRIHGLDCGCAKIEAGEVHLEMRRLTGVLDLRPPDLTCAVRTGTLIADFQSTLAEHGLCIPTAQSQGTVGGAYMAHQGMGGWRDWTIGATFVLADGTMAKSGSHAVKSVAGYDVHRFMAGTRGSLAICLELILRLYPLTMKPPETSLGEAQAEVTDATQIRLMRRAKAIFDPTNKLNPGEWGFM